MVFNILEASPVFQALLAGLFTFFITVLGSSVVFFFKAVQKDFMDGMLSISSGVMLAASFFSLLSPAIEISNQFLLPTGIVICSGFLLGAILLIIFNYLVDTISRKGNSSLSNFRRCILLSTSITLHNIPEGLVIGVAFGAVSKGNQTATLLSAITLTIGIAIQNFPEGSAISLPLRRDGLSRFFSFLVGSFSAIVEPIFAIIGAILVIKIQVLLPFIMSLTAGAMIFVIIMELIPESQTNAKKGFMAFLVMIGFSVMMILELLFS